MNIYDIAKEAGVSIATVSRVLNGSDKVSPRTKEKVLDAIERNGYTPNIFARGLGVGTIRSVGILVPDISDLFMADAVSFLEEELRGNGYNCLLACSGFDRQRQEEHVQMLLSKKVDALILVGSAYAGSGTDPEETGYIRNAAAQVPVFLVNCAVEGEQIYSCVCDDRGAMYRITSDLIGRGRRRILFLTDSDSYSAREKLAGYTDALQEAGISQDPSLILYTRNRIHVVRDLLLSEKEQKKSAFCFEAVVATDDGMAVGAVKYANAMNISIPEELEIVGYNNSSLSVACEPELSSVDNLLSEMCMETVQRLLACLEGNPVSQANLQLGWRLAARQTTMEP